jgi:hypothetical protein
MNLKKLLSMLTKEMDDEKIAPIAGGSGNALRDCVRESGYDAIRNSLA